jgi:hypothetical protein
MTEYSSRTLDDVAKSETPSLIAASKVNGTNVYNSGGDSLGSIYDVMIDKRSGKVAYAVLAFGGFLGMDQNYHPLPWDLLHYDPARDGYVIDVEAERLRSSPIYDATPGWSNEYNQEIDDFYGVPKKEI